MNRIILFLLICIPAIAQAQPKPGTVYPPGKPGQDYNLKDNKGKKNGLWVNQWQTTRNLTYRGFFNHGVPQGKWERYYEDGALAAIMDHVQDTTIIDAVFYHPDGKTVATEGRFVKKKKEGPWKLWNEQGVLVAEENYRDSLLDGLCKYYYVSGKVLKIENYKLGAKDGAYTEYYENGKKRAEGTCVNDVFDGPYKAWFDNGNIDCEGKYVKGMQDGPWYYSYEDGKPKVSLVYDKGKEKKRRYENGNFKEYYDSGIPKSEYNYENGLKDGPFTEWYDKGEYAVVPASEEDKKIGIVYREKLQGTQIKFHGDYVKDKLEGEVYFYRENGSIEKVEEWSDGVLVKTRAAGK